MLVLSRKLGEEIVLPGLDVSIKLLEVHGHRVRIGIVAPQSIDIVRKEVADVRQNGQGIQAAATKESFHVVPKCTISRSAFSVAK